MAMIGEIKLFAFDHAPIGWLCCDGRQIDALHYPKLHALLAQSGKGDKPVCLPDLRGLALAHAGQTDDGVVFDFGQSVGAAAETLSTAHLPAHRHAFVAFATATFANAQQHLSVMPKAGLSRPAACFQIAPSGSAASYEMWVPMTTTPTKMMAEASMGEAGGAEAHDNMSPYLSLNYCMCATDGEMPYFS